MNRPLACVSLLVSLAVGMNSARGETLVFRDVRVFDGARTIQRTTVVVEGGLIRSVAPGAPAPAAATIIEGQGLTLLPGLIDCHTHTFGPDPLRQALVFGVTTGLDMFTSVEFAAAMRAEQKKGEGHDRADLFSAGILVTAPGGHGTQYGMNIPTITSPGEAQAFVDARLAEGSDYIKIVCEDGSAYGGSRPTISKDVLAAVIRAAHARGKLAVVHVSTREAAREAIGAGADGLVHVFADAAIDDALVELAVKRKAFMVPTLTVVEGTGGVASGKTLIDDVGLAAYIGPAEAQNLGRAFPTRANSMLDFAHAREAVRRLAAAGVPILAGSDAPNPGTTHGASVHRELELLVSSGLTPGQALAAATSRPAEKFGLRDRGRIAPRLRADLLLVRGDPGADIRATRNIVGVWKGGRKLDRDAFRDSVQAQRARAATAAATPAPPGSESGLVSDFEGAGTSASFGAGWAVSTDAMVGGKSTAEISQVEGGASGSGHAMRVTGTIEDRPQPRWAGAIFSPGAAPMVPANLSGRKALTFWARGDGGSYSVLLFSQAGGFRPSVRSFVAGPEWKQVRFELSTFDGANGEGITGVFFGGGGSVGKFDLRIDDVRFE